MKVAVLPGDGIGQEIVREAQKVLRAHLPTKQKTFMEQLAARDAAEALNMPR